MIKRWQISASCGDTGSTAVGQRVRYELQALSRQVGRNLSIPLFDTYSFDEGRLAWSGHIQDVTYPKRPS